MTDLIRSFILCLSNMITSNLDLSMSQAKCLDRSAVIHSKPFVSEGDRYRERPAELGAGDAEEPGAALGRACTALSSPRTFTRLELEGTMYFVFCARVLFRTSRRRMVSMIQVVKLRRGNCEESPRWTECKAGLRRSHLLRFFEARRGLRFDLFAAFFGFSAAANSRRFFAAQPGLLTWRPRAIPNPSDGTFSVMVEPAAMYAPSPTRTGATKAVSLPIKTLFPTDVGYL